MNIQQQNGIVSTINFAPFVETEECQNRRKMLFDQAMVASNCSPTNHIDMFDESILVFDGHYQALNFLVHMFRSLAKLDMYSVNKFSLRASLCQGDYFIHQDQIYGDAVNLATRLSCSSRENELLVCGIDSRIIEDFIAQQGDVALFFRNKDENCVSLGLVDRETTSTKAHSKVLQIEHNNQSMLFELSRNRRIMIGRSDDADIYIDGNHISRNHATITLNFETIFIEDHSSNGTYLYFNNREIFLTEDSMKIESPEGNISCGKDRYASKISGEILSFQLRNQNRTAA